MAKRSGDVFEINLRGIFFRTASSFCVTHQKKITSCHHSILRYIQQLLKENLSSEELHPSRSESRQICDWTTRKITHPPCRVAIAAGQFNGRRSIIALLLSKPHHPGTGTGFVPAIGKAELGTWSSQALW